MASPPSTDTVTSGDLPYVIILDPSAFSRDCIAAGLKLLGVPGVVTCNRIEDVPADAECQLVLLSGDRRAGGPELLDTELKAAQRRWPNVGLLLLTPEQDLLALVRRLERLPSIMHADVAAGSLIAAMRVIRNGHRVLPAGLLQDLATANLRRAEPPARAREPRGEARAPDAGTSRQREVMQMLLLGLSNKNIAQRLGITESTVKVHVRAIMNMLNVENRTQIVARLMSGPGHEPAERPKGSES